MASDLLVGKRILITGTSSGVGRVYPSRYLSAGRHRKIVRNNSQAI